MERMNEPPPVTVRDDGYTQDRASQWVAAAVGASAGERVLDLCAAPGGKATAMAAERRVRRRRRPRRCAGSGLIRANATQLGAARGRVRRRHRTTVPAGERSTGC